jgi:hypothetical protein
MRARRLARTRADEFTLRSVTRADELGKLIELARGLSPRPATCDLRPAQTAE